MSEISSKLWHLWKRISTRLYIGFGGAVLISIIISLLALFFLNYIAKVQRSVSEENIPEMRSAVAVAQQTTLLVASAPRLTVSTPEQFEAVAATIDEQVDTFQTSLSAMKENQARGKQSRQIQSDGTTIIQNVERIKLLVRERFNVRQNSLNLRNELQGIQGKLTPTIVKEIDDQMFYMITGYHSLDEAQSRRSAHFSESEFLIYRRLFELRQAAAVTTQLLTTAFIVTDAALLEPLREKFEATAGSISRSLDALKSMDTKRQANTATEDSIGFAVPKNSPVYDRVSSIFEDLISVGIREDNGFDLRSRELAIDGELSALLRKNQVLGTDIAAQVESIVHDSSLAAGEVTGKAVAATATSAKILLAVNIVSISSAILFGWLLIQRRLIRRLERMSNQMRQMADDNLEIDIDTSGNDEIAQLAKALEVFRNNALEVQRLNLVEKLAKELKETNEELTHANEELKRMQDQVVMREKLAALGQLTAGVAHEIQNPMNFIMNFSEVSQELLEELLEEIAKNKANADTREEYNPKLVEEVAEDLAGNLKRIREHGTRANRIIKDMLKMGSSGGGEWQSTDLNVLLNDHAWLAFHSARAADSEFQLEIQENYAPNIGEVTVQPQDLGRVFLNLVTNACYATNEKRRMLATATENASNKDYQPTLKLSTQLIGNRIEVHVRDNGTGIPESILDSIFNPFYTTKPTDKGTGLGLSLSSDIIREHGGEIRVETKEGEYTDMVVVLPLNQLSKKKP